MNVIIKIIYTRLVVVYYFLWRHIYHIYTIVLTIDLFKTKCKKIIILLLNNYRIIELYSIFVTLV